MHKSVRTALTAAVLVLLASGSALASPAEALFTTNCVPCHGASGRGDGPAAAALNPRPRNFTDKAVMSKLTDQQIIDTIKKGGAAMGKSPVMPAFALRDHEVQALVAHVRGFSR